MNVSTETFADVGAGIAISQEGFGGETLVKAGWMSWRRVEVIWLLGCRLVCSIPFKKAVELTGSSH